MKKDKLYLLPPGFIDNNRHEYCPECAEVWGLLAYYPAIKDSVKIIYQPISKPRTAMVKKMGEGHQNCPTLVLAPQSPRFGGVGIERSDKYDFIDNARDIGRYYAKRYGTAVPRGTGPL